MSVANHELSNNSLALSLLIGSLWKQHRMNSLASSDNACRCSMHQHKAGYDVARPLEFLAVCLRVECEASPPYTLFRLVGK